ncbi:hypothetical protein THF5H11_20739 [Vibrio jasicida]|nr:hypothetical protein THF5H11_20739 [Vibrio jasicida]CAH1606888.1 hypothetical protein THF5G08_30340 [Vibrio jasicida]
MTQYILLLLSARTDYCELKIDYSITYDELCQYGTPLITFTYRFNKKLWLYILLILYDYFFVKFAGYLMSQPQRT